MDTKDIKQNTKTRLMDELKSIKGILDADDDNVPLLFDDNEGALDDDDNIPLLVGDNDDATLSSNNGLSDDDLFGDDSDVPVLGSREAASNKASLDAALRQLASLDLPPSASTNKTASDKAGGLEDKIRANAAAPLFKDDKQTTVRENPFLSKNPTARFAESRKQAEDALKSVIAHSRSLSNPSANTPEQTKASTTTVKDNPIDEAIDFTDNQFLKASSAHAEPILTPTSHKETLVTASDERDASDEILKLLDEESEVDLDLDDDFDELGDIDVDALIAEKSLSAKPVPAKNIPVASPAKNKSSDKELDQIVDEVIEEYMVVLEAALRKKLKEKLPDLLKK